MDFESSDTLKFAHCSCLLLLPQDVVYLAAPPNAAPDCVKVDFSKMLSNKINNLQSPYAPKMGFSHSLALG
jgi:hypothetical protein